MPLANKLFEILTKSTSRDETSNYIPYEIFMINNHKNQNMRWTNLLSGEGGGEWDVVELGDKLHRRR